MSENNKEETCEKPNQNFWENKYLTNSTGWDLGEVSPPIKSYIDKLQNKDITILIPGCGNAYEAAYLLNQGFTNVTVIDIAPTLVNHLLSKFKNNLNINIIQGDFFEHQEKYDLIIEQTFFCALPPLMRQKYVWKMHQLLKPKGILMGLLFNRDFDVSPPFGGSLAEYQNLFKNSFDFNVLAVAKNSMEKRQGSELFFEFKRNNKCKVNLYNFERILNAENRVIISQELINGVLNFSFNNDFSELLIVSENGMEQERLNQIVFRQLS